MSVCLHFQAVVNNDSPTTLGTHGCNLRCTQKLHEDFFQYWIYTFFNAYFKRFFLNIFALGGFFFNSFYITELNKKMYIQNVIYRFLMKS